MSLVRLCITCLVLLQPYHFAQAAWFEKSDIVSKMHERLLEDDLDGMFKLMVQIWQQESEQYLRPHLNDLLEQAIEKDCGKSLMNEGLPVWLDNVTINKNTVQDPGRTSDEVLITFESDSAIETVSFIRWPDTPLTEKKAFQTVELESSSNRLSYATAQSYLVSHDIKGGLYQLIIQDVNGENWKSWVILDAIQPAQQVRWESSQSWAVDKSKLLNPSCPLPKQTVEVLEYENGEYRQAWKRSYEPHYSEQLPENIVPPNHYLVRVSMLNSRWQGAIVIQNQNTISKTMDLTEKVGKGK